MQRFRLEKQEPSFALHFPLRILGTCPKEILKGTESQSPGGGEGGAPLRPAEGLGDPRRKETEAY